MNRRDFLKAGSLMFTFAAKTGWAFDFVADDDSTNVYNHCIPFRKEAREIREVVAGFLWADAADFASYGSWALDTQHVGFMGSSYLLAHGTSRTVKDATLKINKVKPGKYRLWVRSRNWIVEHSPGRFGVLVNGKDSGVVYGSQKEKGWTWQDGGVHELSGEVHFNLQDKTGQFGRCSSIILTRDLKYKPPTDVEKFKKERARLSGVSDAIQRGKEYDVIVVGAGPAGGCAAIASARMGAKTALISNRPVLGGNASVEIGVRVQGAAKKHMGKPVRETGIIEEAGRIEWADAVRERRGNEFRHCTISRSFEKMAKAEPLLDLYENSWLEDAKKEGSYIREVILRDTLTGQRTVISGKMFIDCSGDAWLGYHAGADERIGREARSEFNEADAPEKADKITMSGTLRGASKDCCENFFYKTVQASKPQPFNPPPWIYDIPEGWEYGRGNTERLLGIAMQGSWWLEHPGDVDDLWNPEFARDELIRVNYTFWNYMKNKWSGRSKLSNYSLEYIPFMVGKRESRRLMGDYVMNANDALQARKFKDAIAHTGWSLDVHHPSGILSTEGPNGPNRRIPIGEIPYRCLYSRNIDNLLMAGRCASVTHEALGTVRIEASCAVTGQAAGTAAALALNRKTTPRGVYQKHMKELQQVLLKHDQYIPGVLNEDPADLALGCDVRASSMRTSTDYTKGKEQWLSMKTNRGEFFKWQSGKRLQCVQLYLESKSEQKVTLHLRQAKAGNDLSASNDAAMVSRKIPAGTKGWVEFPVDAVLDFPFTWVYLEAADSVQWRSSPSTNPRSFRLFGSDKKWTSVKGSSMSIRLVPDIAAEDLFLPANIVNGVARPTLDGKFNYWESAHGKSLPQWIELTLKRPSKVGLIQCVFDTDLTLSIPTQSRDPLPASCVRDYTLECRVNDVWKRVARVRDNFQRFRRHEFSQVAADKVRLTVEATHGAKTARIMEIRIYAGDARVTPDLVTPVMTEEAPAAGRRVRQVAPEYKGTDVYHSLYLPVDWKPGGKFPVIVEYTGNKFPPGKGSGEVKDANLGYGMSGGRGFIWICMPYVEKGRKKNAVKWWGDKQATVDYCKVNLPRICKEFGGDTNNVFVCGFSRGAIGSSYIGLADDQIASFWKGMFTHDHFDGQKKWGYPESDRKFALKRLGRLKGRSVLVCGQHASHVREQFLKDHLDLADFTFLDVPVNKIFNIPEGKVFHQHTDMWMHRDSKYRRQARDWLQNALKDKRIVK